MTVHDTIEKRAELRGQLQKIREELGEMIGELGYIDHEAAKAIYAARDKLHDAWSILRALPKEI